MKTVLNGLTAKTLAAMLIAVLFSNTASAVTKTASSVGNWSAAGTWSPSGVPASTDDVIIASGATVTIDGNYTCNNLDLGSTPITDSKLQIISSGNSLTINGDLRINPTNKSKIYTLDAGPGTINIAGTFSAWGIAGADSIKVGTGSINFTPAVTIANAFQVIAFTDAGTVNFNGAFTDKYNKLITYTGCTVNFGSTYTVNTTAANWNGKGTAVFTGASCSITPTSNLTLNDVQVAASKSLTLNTGVGTVVVGGSVTLASGSTFTAGKDFQLNGSWINNGGTFTGTGYTVILNGASATLGGTSSTSFNNLTVGRSGAGATSVSYSTSNDINCTNLSFDGNTLPRTLTLGSGKIFNISGNLTINQPTIAAYTNTFDVSAGTCNLTGNLVYAGTSTTATKVSKVNVTSGSLNVNGNVTWSIYPSATKVLAVSTGTVSFANSLTMGSSSGTINITGAATVNFNGATTPSLAFGGTTAPVFTTATGANINFAKGFSATTTALNFASGTTVVSGSPDSPVNFTVTGTNTVTNNGNLTVYGDLVGSTSGSAFVNGANSTLTLYGSAMSTGTFTATAAGNTVNYAGSSAQSVKTGTYNSLILSGAGAKTLSGNITVADVTLSSASLDDAGYTVTVTGANGWTNNSGTYTTTGGVSFTGATASQIGGISATTFKNLTLNKSGGVTLNAPVAVNGALTLTSGVIATSATNYLQLSSGATCSQGSASTYVDGPMYKVGNTDFTFPVGNAGRWRRVGVSGMTSPTTRISAQYFAATPPNKNSRNSTVSDVSSEEYWDVDRTVTSDPIKITLYWETKPLSSLSLDCSSLVIAHYKNGAWQRETSTLKSSALSCLLGGSGSMETDWVSSFSPFGFGGDGGGALPIKLVSFDAVLNGNVVETKWITELEINNAYFTLERSTDVETWEEVARVDGAGNSTNILTYEKADVNPKIGTTYYRLKQTDFDGQFAYSNIVPVTVEGVKSNFTVYPNPTDNELTLNVKNPSDEINITIYDLTGRKMYSRMFGVDKGSNSHEITIQAKYLLPTGVYMMSVATNGTEHRERVVLN